MKAYFGRRYTLSASHRLHSENLSEIENQAIYGKCNNPYGHGHNYIVEVVMGGQVDPETGMVSDLVELDACVRKEILDRFDHTNLNTHACFQNLVPTTENFNIVIHDLLRTAFMKAELSVVRVEETSNNSFEYPVANSFERSRGAHSRGKGSAA
ncbi:6-pyruvoyltetrahydropterin/6-carboxytetrahydropterin synthase [Silvibacterium bohemicum]|uniref:6-carboxy-5,6,7,8-tetrahydropterin synthase n=1 Tax=Silvibacterium bohemicum TaxID=1577686 RepID=A0A841JUY9_9BACT|nr:6-carboxytetrahydropterin synthase [Silvibacterium bohemicum]MBB6145156.1 6-pyruvoyltetrahydropterin/6-carboxytetrahydropterin synthase [Silvibacterium bohemicum]